MDVYNILFYFLFLPLMLASSFTIRLTLALSLLCTCSCSQNSYTQKHIFNNILCLHFNAHQWHNLFSNIFILTISKAFHSTESRNNRSMKNKGGTALHDPSLDNCTYKTLTSPTVDEKDATKSISHCVGSSK